MPRKSNSEKDIVITSGGAAAARPKRTTSAPRAKRPAATTAAPATTNQDPVTSVAAFVAQRQLSHEEIARVAYLLWEARGCQHGGAEDDWRRAEEQLRQLARVAGA